LAFRPVMQKPQTDWLLQHFKKAPSISGQEAAAMFRIRSLPRRILDLEERGHRFARELRFDTTGQRYIRYHYLGQAA
jgi:hypothetical protein